MKYSNSYSFLLGVILSSFAGVGCGVDESDPEQAAADGYDSPDSVVAVAEQGLRAVAMKGDVGCAWGSAACNRCVNNVASTFDRLTDSYKTGGRIRIDGYAYPTSNSIMHRINSSSYEHIQSMNRLSGIGDNEYMVFTHSTDSAESNKQGALAIVRLGADRSSGGYAFGNLPNGDGSNQATSNRSVAARFTGNNHPGGLSVLGKYVFVAQWCQPHGDGYDPLLEALGIDTRWCKESSFDNHGMGFSVYDVSRAADNATINSNPPKHKYYYHAYGESWIDNSSTAGIAAVKLASGQYLAALSKSGGGGYAFYTADSITGPYTPHSSEAIGYYGESATMVTECGTGNIYHFQIEGYGSSDDVDKVHLYKMITKSNNEIGFEYVKSRSFLCRGSSVDGAGDWCHFDAGAGLYVTPSGGLILYASEWQQSDAGNIRLVEFN